MTISISSQEEAIPANLSVASSRYSLLVSLLHSLQCPPSLLHLPSLLAAMFHTPGPWLPENVGSVLLLLGQAVTRDYLRYCLGPNPTPGCVTCFKPVATALTGLAVMTARFRRPFTAVFRHLDEVMAGVAGDDRLRHGLLTALWEGLAREVRDLRQAEGEEWAVEGARHLYRVIREVGRRMMEKAYMGYPVQQGEGLSSEE